MAIERNFSIGDQIMHTQQGTKVTVIGKVTAFDKNLLVIEIQFCSNSHGNRIPSQEFTERKIHENAANLVNLSRIVSSANQKGYLLDR